LYDLAVVEDILRNLEEDISEYHIQFYCDLAESEQDWWQAKYESMRDNLNSFKTSFWWLFK
jgi:uncharacterized protein YpuA (DUF1002 family)